MTAATGRKPLRIAEVVATFPPYRGGTGNVCFHNARELARRGHEVHVFTIARPGAPKREERAGLYLHRLRPLVRSGNAGFLPGLLWSLRGFDVIHLHYPFFGSECVALAAWASRTPLIVTYQHDVHLPGVMGWVEWLLRQTVVRWTLRRARRVLFSSGDYAEASHVRPFLKDRADRIGILPNGVDTSVFCPGTASSGLRECLGLQCGEQVALLVAGLDRAHYFKGVDVFLDALSRLPPTIRGLIVGDGDLRPTYEATVERLGLSSRVRFAGRVADEDLPDYYRLADVTVLPSVTMGEAFGLVLVESMACGTPVIASSLPGVRSVVDHGVNGLLVKPGEPVLLGQAITEILGDEARRCTMGSRGRAKAEEQYDWASIGLQLAKCCRELHVEL